jgi:hypothetical protein
MDLKPKVMDKVNETVLEDHTHSLDLRRLAHGVEEKVKVMIGHRVLLKMLDVTRVEKRVTGGKFVAANQLLSLNLE